PSAGRGPAPPGARREHPSHDRGLFQGRRSRTAAGAAPRRPRSAEHQRHTVSPPAADAMARLRSSGLDRLIPQLRAPVLGICLGMQLLFEHSAEGDTACLGVIDGQIERLRAAPGLPVPHMGWNTLEIQCEDPLLAGIGAADRLYFVHSYAAPVCEGTLASVHYGGELCASVRRDN